MFLKKQRKSNIKFPVHFSGVWGLTTLSYIPLVDIENLQSINVTHIEYIYILILYTYTSIHYTYFLCSQNVRDSHGGGSDHVIYISVFVCSYKYLFICLSVESQKYILTANKVCTSPQRVTYIYIYIISTIVTCIKSSLVTVNKGTIFQIRLR
jgi:hypothetical protein